MNVLTRVTIFFLLEPCVMTTRRPLVTTSPPTTPKTLHTRDEMTSTKKPIVATRGPTKRGGMKDQSGQSGEKGNTPK